MNRSDRMKLAYLLRGSNLFSKSCIQLRLLLFYTNISNKQLHWLLKTTMRKSNGKVHRLCYRVAFYFECTLSNLTTDQLSYKGRRQRWTFIWRKSHVCQITMFPTPTPLSWRAARQRLGGRGTCQGHHVTFAAAFGEMARRVVILSSSPLMTHLSHHQAEILLWEIVSISVIK